MSDTGDVMPAARPAGKARGFRLPSFRVAAAISVATLAAFAVWVFFDESYFVAEEIAVYDLPLNRSPWAYSNREILPRLILLAILSVTAIASVALMLSRLLRGTLADRKLSGWFVAITIVGLWLAFVGSRPQIAELGWHWRVRRLIAGLEQDVPHVPKTWPTSGKLPFLGKFSTDSAGVLISDSFVEMTKQSNMFPMSVVVTTVTRSDGGAIRFGLLSYRHTFVEYRPDDRPQPLTDRPPRQMVRVKPHWFVDQLQRD